jgi:hypothetical protein
MNDCAKKDTVKNPFFTRGRRMVRGARIKIQSLRAFSRQSRGRGGAPLLPSLWRGAARRFVCCAVPLFFFLSTPAYTQDTNGAAPKIEEKRLDVLFDRIMQTLPDRERNLVDSAGEARSASRGAAAARAQAKDDGKKPQAGAEANRLRDLPPELKEQVERAMADMKERNDKRQAQFIDARRGKK